MEQPAEGDAETAPEGAEAGEEPVVPTPDEPPADANSEPVAVSAEGEASAGDQPQPAGNQNPA